MGNGIVANNGGNPVDEWHLRIVNVNSPALSTHVLNFIRGQPVSAAQSNPRIAVADLADANAHTFTFSMPGAPIVLDVMVQAVPSSGAKDPDPRSSLPSPTSWLVDPDNAALTWELFNCVVLYVRPRSATV